MATSKPSNESQMIVILEVQFSHTRHIDLVGTNYVTIIPLLHHFILKMQPLDISFMSPLKSHYSEAQWMLLNEREVTTFDIMTNGPILSVRQRK